MNDPIGEANSRTVKSVLPGLVFLIGMSLSMFAHAQNDPGLNAAAPRVVQRFEVEGGQLLPMLRCPPPVRPKPRPQATVPTAPGAGAPAPAGSQEEIVPLSPGEEQDMLAQALAPPDHRELARLKPPADRLVDLQARLNEAATRGGPRVAIWGGSHMAAEFFTTEIRRSLQIQWGQAESVIPTCSVVDPGFVCPWTRCCVGRAGRKKLRPEHRDRQIWMPEPVCMPW